jgi:hypothetical protein
VTGRALLPPVPPKGAGVPILGLRSARPDRTDGGSGTAAGNGAAGLQA